MEEEMTEENNEGGTDEVRDPKALLAAYNKSKEDLLTLREEYKAIKAKMDELSQDRFRLQALSAETKLALQEKGIKDVNRLLPYIGTEGLDFDDEGKVTGLNERLDQLKKDLPEIFDAKRRAGGKADIYADSATEPTVDPMREQIRRALNA